MKIGDKLIKTRTYYGEINLLEIVTIKKVNKSTYKLSDDSLVYIKGFRLRGGNSSYGARSDFEEFTEERYQYYKDRILNKKVDRAERELKSSRLLTKEILNKLLDRLEV